jgi:superfamily I DNA/RNA helicase
VWPDLRRRGSVLEADRLGRDGLADPPGAAALLAEERRLLYVAVTRAREHLLVTAVRARDDDEGAQPSRLLDDLGVPVEQVPGRPALAARLVAALRRAAVDPPRAPTRRRGAPPGPAGLAA